jgi:hypothetical protein
MSSAETLRFSSIFLPPMLLLALASCAHYGVDPITATELREHVAYLADDARGGRRVGSAGIADAELYIESRFSDAGLDPLPGSDTLFLDFSLVVDSFDRTATTLSSITPDGERSFAPGSDFRPFDFSSHGEFRGELIFAGYGITAPEYGHDDYADLDVTGRVVLVLRHEPGERDPESPWQGLRHTPHALFVEKAKNAARHGAVAMLLVTDPLHHDRVEDLRPSR